MQDFYAGSSLQILSGSNFRSFMLSDEWSRIIAEHLVNLKRFIIMFTQASGPHRLIKTIQWKTPEIGQKNWLLFNKRSFRWHSFDQRCCVTLCRNLAGYWIINWMQAVHSAFLFGISPEKGLFPEESPCHDSETEAKDVS